MPAPLPGEVVFDERLVRQPYHIDLDTQAVAEFATAACAQAQVHPDAMDALRLVYTAGSPPDLGLLGLYTPYNQTATVFVRQCVNYALDTDRDPGQLLSEFTAHEIGHHLIPSLGYKAAVVLWTAVGVAMGTRPWAAHISTAATFGCLEGVSMNAMGGLLAARWWDRSMERRHGMPYREVGASAMEQLGAQYPMVTYTPFERLDSWDTTKDVVREW